VLQQVDTTLVRGYRRPLVTDLLGTGTISGTSVKYFIEGALEGSPGMVAAGAQKPQIHLGDPTYRTDEVKKIAAWWDMQDEMIEDIPFWVSEINGRGLQKLSEVEENQLLNGDGTGQNLLGVLNRDGVQVHTGKAADIADELYKAMSKVQLATGLVADGLIINPVDYQALRLNKDGNGQYFGGGYFSGQYGNGGIVWQPPVWGLNTVVSVAAVAGSPVLGAFKQATTVYRKGGVRVESTNSDQGKFTSDIYTTRIEERLALAVRVPSAIVKLKLT
jgi:HK97 family phage major capsid protein